MSKAQPHEVKNYVDRSILLSELLEDRAEYQVVEQVDKLVGESGIGYEPLAHRAISELAWNHVVDLDVKPWQVFAHEEILRELPRASLYYRGLTLLSKKGVERLARSIDSWEHPEKRPRITEEALLEVVRLYNSFISCLIEQSENWTIEDGYRNIIATTGIGFDGIWRNYIGKKAEHKVRQVITEFLRERFPGWDFEDKDIVGKWVSLPRETNMSEQFEMKFGSEPDISFVDQTTFVRATIEIKGGLDRAGALERFGAMRKSFEETAKRTRNFLILGVITDEVEKRLEELDVETYLLSDLDKESIRAEFLDELFHHAVRIIGSTISEADLP